MTELDPPIIYYLKRDGSNADSDLDIRNYDILASIGSFSTVSVNDITVISQVTVTNLYATNADTLDGQHLSYFTTGVNINDVLLQDGSRALTADWDAGNYDILASIGSFSTASVNTLTVISQTTVNNLNADTLWGFGIGTSGASVPLLNALNTWSADQTFNDNVKMTFGTGGDADIWYTGGNLKINPKVVGVGRLLLDTNSRLAFRDTFTDVHSPSSQVMRFSAIGLGARIEWYVGLLEAMRASSSGMNIGHTVGGNYVNFNASGDVRFVGGAGLVFGSCYGNHIGWSQANAEQNTWYDIYDDDMADGILHNVTHDSKGTLTVTEPGMYLVSYSICFEDDAANDHVEAGIEVSDSGSADPKGICHLENKFANEEEHMGSSTILDLADNATLCLTIRTTDAGTPTISVQAVNLTCVQIGGT